MMMMMMIDDGDERGHVCVLCVCTQILAVPWHSCGSQIAALGSWFSPYPTGPREQLKSPRCTASMFTMVLSLQP